MQPQQWQVVVGGAVVGRVDLLVRDDEVAVLDVDLVDLRHVDVLRALLDCRALADGARSVTVDVTGDVTVDVTVDVPGEGAGAAAALAATGFETASVRMRLDLTTLLPGSASSVRLAPMGQEAYAAFIEVLADDYVRERAASGESPDRARDVMETQLADLLPDGPQSTDQHLFTAWVGDTVVGHLWIATGSGPAFVYYVEVVEEQRRRGHGAALMGAAAAWAREHGADEVRLNVFGHNTAARALYAGLGYVATSTTYRRAVGR